MGMPGIGAMLRVLGGGSENSADKYYGRKIKNAVFDKAEDAFRITFEDGVTIAITDQGQSCCEHRYMTCDDDPTSLSGGILKHIKVKKGPDLEDQYGDPHEVAFLEVATDKGFVTFATHNEHNGYYGGFGLTISEQLKPE